MKRARIWLRKDRQQWYGSYHQAGRRVVKRLGSKQKAMQWKTFIEFKLNHESWQGVRGIDWTTATRLFLEEKAVDSAASTVVELRNSLTAFEQIVGPLQTNLVTQVHINDFRKKRKEYRPSSKKLNDVSNRTVNKDLANLRSFFNWLTESSLAHGDLNFKMLPVPKKKFIPPTTAQLNELLNLAKEHPPLYMRIILGIMTDLRRGALERIKLSDVDEHIDLERSLLTSFETKTNEWVHKTLGPNTMKSLYEYLEWLPEGSKKLFADRWDGKTRNTWERIRKLVGLPRLRFHDLRSIAVSFLAETGETKEQLQKALGHASYKTTERHYLAITDETSQRITKKLDSMFDDA